MLFLAQVFYSPAEKFTENPENKEYDENPYNDADTEDMLRHFKLEYFLMANSSAFVITEIVFLCGFYKIKDRGPVTDADKLQLICCMIPRILRYIYYSISLALGNEFFE